MALVAKANKEQKVALIDCLYVYGRVRGSAQKIRLLDVDCKSMTLQFKHEAFEAQMDKVLPLEPPLNSVNEFSSRLREMGRAAARERGLAPFCVDEVSYPGSHWGDLVILVLVSLPLSCYIYRPLLHQLFRIGGDSGAVIADWLDNDSRLLFIVAMEFLIHSLESLVLLNPKLAYYRAPVDCKIEWYIMGLIEGYAPVKRLERLAETYDNK